MNENLIQWILLASFGLIFFFIAPMARNAEQFFGARSSTGRPPTVFLLASSLVIAWIFAKSIANAANLGQELGFVGGFSYACYYLSFLTGGIIIYRMRQRGRHTSIHNFLRSRYGSRAVAIFSIVIGFRLFNEVWSNTTVIGSYFGAQGTLPFYVAVLLFTALTLAYTLKGGMRTSLITDSVQMFLFGLLLAILLIFILPQSDAPPAAYFTEGSWTMAGGLSFLFTVLIQIFSYPFHDPVLTDRGFMSPPGPTLKAYMYAAVVGFLCILLFSFIGIFARLEGLAGPATVAVSRTLGTGVMLAMNLIMITSAASTIDSTFSSSSKLLVVDLGRSRMATIPRGRLAMIAVATVGTIPVFFGADILSATTISGTMVIGLAPIFLFWRLNMPPLSFHLSIWTGVAAGIVLALNLWPASLVLFEGKYGPLLSVNLIGSLLCFAVFFLPKLFTSPQAS